MNTKNIYSDERKQRNNFLFPRSCFFFDDLRLLSFLAFLILLSNSDEKGDMKTLLPQRLKLFQFCPRKSRKLTSKV